MQLLYGAECSRNNLGLKFDKLIMKFSEEFCCLYKVHLVELLLGISQRQSSNNCLIE
jgi:hypothetical protein